MIFPQMLYKVLLYLLSFSHKTMSKLENVFFILKHLSVFWLYRLWELTNLKSIERFMSKKQMLQIRVFSLTVLSRNEFQLEI